MLLLFGQRENRINTGMNSFTATQKQRFQLGGISFDFKILANYCRRGIALRATWGQWY